MLPASRSMEIDHTIDRQSANLPVFIKLNKIRNLIKQNQVFNKYIEKVNILLNNFSDSYFVI